MADSEPGMTSMTIARGTEIIWVLHDLKPPPPVRPRDLPKFGGTIPGAWLLHDDDILQKTKL
eukprot:6502090-Alexandrium_andersonii.AAC.1